MKTREKKSVRNGLDKRLGVAAAQPHVAELFALEAGERHDDAVEKRLAAHDAHIRVGLRLLNEMLPRPKTDLKPDFARRRGKSPPRRQRFRTDRKERKRFGEQAFLTGAKRLAAAASVEPAKRRRTVRPAVRHH